MEPETEHPRNSCIYLGEIAEALQNEGRARIYAGPDNQNINPRRARFADFVIKTALKAGIIRE